MRKILHRVAPYARRIRAVADVAGPALHVLLFLPRPRWANRLLLGAAAAASVAGWVAEAAAGEEGDWRLLPLGPAADLACEAVLGRAHVLDRRGLVSWVRLPDGDRSADLIVRQRDQREPRELFARDGEVDAALDVARRVAWEQVGGLARLAPVGAGLTVEAVGEVEPHRPAAAGTAEALRGALWPALGVGAGGPASVVVAGPRGSRLAELARLAAAVASAEEAVGDPARVDADSAGAVAAGARVLEVAAGALLAAPGEVRAAVAALAPRLLLVEVGPVDLAAPVAAAARLAARGAPGCSVALLCSALVDAESAPLLPGDSAFALDVDAAEAGASLADLLGVEGADPVADRCAAALASATGARSFVGALSARAEAAEALRNALARPGVAERVAGWPVAFAALAALRMASAPSGEDEEAEFDEARALAEAALADWGEPVEAPAEEPVLH